VYRELVPRGKFAKVKNAWSYTSLFQYVFMVWCSVMHRNNFTLPVYQGLKIYNILPFVLYGCET